MADPKLPKDTGPQKAFLELARKEVEDSPLKLSSVASMGDAPAIERALTGQVDQCAVDLQKKGACEMDVKLDGGDKMRVFVDPTKVSIERMGETSGKTTIKLSQNTRDALKM